VVRLWVQNPVPPKEEKKKEKKKQPWDQLNYLFVVYHLADKVNYILVSLKNINSGEKAILKMKHSTWYHLYTFWIHKQYFILLLLYAYVVKD
jgi:hypothetical protein